MGRTEYLYGSQSFEAERARLTALEGLNDPTSIRVLETVGVARGWRCLEVGGGGGSLARWLCERVGPEGSVVATDLDPRFLEALDVPGLEVRQHDILSDPLEADSFDLVHSRYVLEHLKEDDVALRAMIGALKPGGVLVAEDVDLRDLVTGGNVIGPPEAARDLAAIGSTLAALAKVRGLQLDHGYHLPSRLREHGLQGIDAVCTRYLMVGGTPQAEMPRRTLLALKDAAVASGMGSGEAFDQATAWMSEPSLMQFSPTLVSAWGRKP